MHQPSGDHAPCLSHPDAEYSTSLLEVSQECSETPPLSRGNQPARPDDVSSITSTRSDIDEVPRAVPNNAMPITRALYFSWSESVTDAISILSTIPFIVLACLIAKAKGEPVHKASLQHFNDAIIVAATTLPIVFAAVFGRLAGQVARWRLERGASLPSIEQWHGSRTVFSAAMTQFRLGGWTLVGPLLITIWALSPLGTQSILRVFWTAYKEVNSQGLVTYFDTNTPPFPTQMSFWNNPVGPRTEMDFSFTGSIYASALMSADRTKAASQDSFGNVKIPYLSSYSKDPSTESWVRVPEDGNLSFSSLLGLPSVTISPGSQFNYSFTLDSSYIELQCSDFTQSSYGEDSYVNWQKLGSYFNNKSLITSPSSLEFPEVPNGTWQAIRLSATNTGLPWILASDTFLDPLWLKRKSEWKSSQYTTTEYSKPMDDFTTYSPNAFANESNIAATQAKLSLRTEFFSFYLGPSIQYSTTCTVSQNYVESQVRCRLGDSSGSRECAVIAQRPSQQPHASTNITHLSFPYFFSALSQRLPLASGLRLSYGISDASLLYLSNTSTSFLLDTSSYSAPEFGYVTSRDTSDRLGHLINTYLIASQAYDCIPSGTVSGYVNNLTTSMVTQTTVEVIAISTPWLAVFFVVAFAMLLGSIAGAVLCHMSSTPEILGFVSSMIRDSKHVNLQPGFGGLGGFEMTKAFEGIEFQYGVVGKIQDGPEMLGVSWKVNVASVQKGVPYV